MGKEIQKYQDFSSKISGKFQEYQENGGQLLSGWLIFSIYYYIFRKTELAQNLPQRYVFLCEGGTSRISFVNLLGCVFCKNARFSHENFHDWLFVYSQYNLDYLFCQKGQNFLKKRLSVRILYFKTLIFVRKMRWGGVDCENLSDIWLS